MSLEQRLSEALVAILDTAPAVAALTGRASGNVVAWESQAPLAPLPVLAYVFITGDGVAPIAGDDACNFQLTALASRGDTATARALLDAALDAITHTALAAVGSPDAMPLGVPRRFRVPVEREDEAARADAEVTIIATP